MYVFHISNNLSRNKKKPICQKPFISKQFNCISLYQSFVLGNKLKTLAWSTHGRDWRRYSFKLSSLTKDARRRIANYLSSAVELGLVYGYLCCYSFLVFWTRAEQNGVCNWAPFGFSFCRYMHVLVPQGQNRMYTEFASVEFLSNLTFITFNKWRNVFWIVVTVSWWWVACYYVSYDITIAVHCFRESHSHVSSSSPNNLH